jgi:hypothetical protein
MNSTGAQVTDIANADVARTFASYPPPLRRKLLALRALILDTAAATPGVGAIEETLKWGEPAYLTSASKSGSTIRLGPVKSSPSHYALYFNCNTTLVDTFRTLFPQALRYDGNRAIVLDSADALPRDALAFCIQAALTYHRKKPRAWPALTSLAGA